MAMAMNGAHESRWVKKAWGQQIPETRREGYGGAAAPPSTKKQRVVSPGNQNARCQVEGCTADLSSAKEYHRRHKVCEMHSKASKAIADGREQRFCQQCSRFHTLTEFDEGKRSCRRRLAGHNERRRKPQPNSQQQGFNCRSSSSSSPMLITDSLQVHGTASLSDWRQIQHLQQQIRGLRASLHDNDDDDCDDKHFNSLANGNLSSPPRGADEKAQALQIQQVGGGKEGQAFSLDPVWPQSHRLLTFCQSPTRQMQGGVLNPLPDVGLSSLATLVSQELVAGTKGSLGHNLFLGSLENNNQYLGCDSQISSCALSLQSWGTPCLPALDVGTTHSTISEQLIADNTTGSNTASFAHHLQPHLPEEQCFAFEELHPVLSEGLGVVGIRDSRITENRPLEQTHLHGGWGSGNFLSSLGGLGFDAGNCMSAILQSSHEMQGMRSGVSSVLQSLQVHQHLHQIHASDHLQSQTSLNGECGEFSSLWGCANSLFST